MHGAMTMDELRDSLNEIMRFMGRHDEALRGINEQLTKQNGRVSKLEESHAAIHERVAEARGAWKAISAASALIGGGVAWAAKHFLPILFIAAVKEQTAVCTIYRALSS